MSEVNSKAEKESNARRCAEETVAALEKEKTILDLELQELVSKHSQDMDKVNASLSAVSIA